MLPFMWAFAMLVYALITRKQKRRRNLLIAALLLLYLFGNPCLYNLYAKAWDIDPYQINGKKYDLAILLGGFISQDQTGEGYFNDSKDRYVQATKLLANHTITHLLMTGGNGSLTPDGFSEGAFVKGELKKMGFPDSSILIESKARNTFENAALSHAILKKTGLKPPYLLVTSGFHMRRALMVFKKEGLEVVPFPCDYKTYKGLFSVFDLLPASETYGNWNLYIKELIGYLITMLK
ncbi:hypothetical protein A0256_05140 [Mucilaginibacter sp. PAMC 26640]|nr:hypothetical protein A0256_05140 [Mucilaginibacter sp. PAMC 26640]